MWITDNRAADRAEGLFRFRRGFFAPSGSTLTVRVSADTRYKLFLNGAEVLIGPCKGNRFVTYYETADLTPLLRDGENELLVLVVHLDRRMASFHRTERMAFMLDGVVHMPDGDTDISSDENWQVAHDPSFECTSPDYWCLTDFTEHIHFDRAADLDWQQAARVCDAVFDREYAFGEMPIWRLSPRTIPAMTRTPLNFDRVMRSSLDATSLIGGGEVTFAPDSEHFIEVALSEHRTGTPHIALSGGKGASVRLTYAESYVFKDGWRIKKKHREDLDGIIYGMTDLLDCDGGDRVYEPFWFRTVRFMRIEVKTADQPLTLSDLCFFENKYPLTVSASFDSSDPDSRALWETSIRTVNNCMHETFEDCPYYEQTQYAMDSRLEALFTYQLSSDRALAKKCLDEFMTSQYPDGMTQARYPSMVQQVIPGFSLHVIYMADDYMRYAPNDRRYVRSLLPKIDGILGWFDRLIDENGVVGDTEHWRFIDWVDGWRDGVPSKEPTSIISFMYATALRRAADMNRCFGYGDIAAEYDLRADAVNNAAVKLFFDTERGLFKDCASGGYSQHAQIWAVLAGAVDGSMAREVIERMLADDSLARCSYSMMFFFFRALEKVGLYEKAYACLDRWRAMLQRGCTTWVEDDVQERSDCHGWGALPIYEFAAVVLGVKPIGYDGDTVKIAPNTVGLTRANGTVCTPGGNVTVGWRIDGDKFRITVSAESDMRLIIVLPDGTSHEARCTFGGECEMPRG